MSASDVNEKSLQQLKESVELMQSRADWLKAGLLGERIGEIEKAGNLHEELQLEVDSLAKREKSLLTEFLEKAFAK